MDRQSMAADHGMLFRFDQTRDSADVDEEHAALARYGLHREEWPVARIAENTVPFSEPSSRLAGPVRYVLELNAGTAARHGVAPGDRVRHRVMGN
jgi:uncharacterized membrane protein (UPF0127 family)